MSYFFNTPTDPVARAQYRCVYCDGQIPKGEKHRHQKGVFDGDWQSNRYHFECWDVLSEQRDFEFMPGEGEMPERVAALMPDVK